MLSISGHLAIALKLCRQEQELLTPDKSLELCHHIIRSGIFREGHDIASVSNCLDNDIVGRDLQSLWMSLSTDDMSAALGCHRHLSSPDLAVTRLLLASGASPHFVVEGSPLLSICGKVTQKYRQLIEHNIPSITFLHLSKRQSDQEAQPIHHEAFCGTRCYVF